MCENVHGIDVDHFSNTEVPRDMDLDVEGEDSEHDEADARQTQRHRLERMGISV